MKGLNYKKRNSDDMDKHPVGCVQMKKRLQEKACPAQEDSLGEAIMQRHEEVVNWRLEQACQELEDCELTAVWPMNGKCEWQEQWVQIRYWLSSYWICNLQLVISNTWSTLYTLQRAILAGRGVPSKGKSKTNLTRPYLDSKSLW